MTDLTPAERKREGLSRGGKNSPVRPFRDPAKAREAVNARWAKYREAQKKAIDADDIHD